jgi:hypothetical protein
MKLLIDPAKDSATNVIHARLLAGLVKDFKLLESNPKNEGIWKRIELLFDQNLQQLFQASYRTGCKEVAVNPSSSDTLRLQREAKSRALWVTNEMKTWTLQSLGLQAASKKDLLGKERAKRAIDNETYLSFYHSRNTAWQRNREARKESVLAEEHPENDDICEENADAGPIDVNDEFPSGHRIPPYHIGCYCRIWLHVPQNLVPGVGYQQEKFRVL